MYFNNQLNSYGYQRPVQKNEFAWVQGETGAKGFMVPPGMTMWLMDAENPVFYIKETDMNGFPKPLRIFDFKERTTQPKEPEYVTKDEMKKYIEEILKHESIVPTAESNAEHVKNAATVSELPKQL